MRTSKRRRSSRRSSVGRRDNGNGVVWIANYGSRYIVRFRVPARFGQRGYWSQHIKKSAALREARRAARSLKRDFYLGSVKVLGVHHMAHRR